MSWTEIMKSQPLFQNTFISRRPRVAIFTDIIYDILLRKLQPCLLQQPLKTQKKLKELEIMYQNAIYINISWCSKFCCLLERKMLIAAYLKGRVT